MGFEFMLIKNRQELIENGLTSYHRKAREIALNVLEEVLKEADPKIAVKNSIEVSGETTKISDKVFNLKELENIYVVGAGKAGGGMAEAVEELLGSKIKEGYVNIPEGTAERYRTNIIELNEASHPIPSDSGVKGSERILKILEKAGKRDLVLVLISGGGSALIPAPSGRLTLKDLQSVTDDLLRSGAAIDEINVVRKHLSDTKGGGLAAAAYPANVVSLIISDVVGDPINTIASGPTAPDSSTYNEALEILRKYHLEKEHPGVADHLGQGVKAAIPETVKPGDRVFKDVHNVLICSNKMVLEKVLENLKQEYEASILTTEQEGEAREVGVKIGRLVADSAKKGAPESKPRVIIAGGETTVTVRGGGKGGRNQELVLGALSYIKGARAAVASAGSDGIDGVTDAAGAIADGMSYPRSIKVGLSHEDYLGANNSYYFFQKLQDLIITGPTGTNINDVTIIVFV